jgi:two-component system, sensor histidine kinase and response regulator
MKKIAIIEDDLIIRNNIVTMLMLEGYDVVQAENGMVGVTLIQNQRPDLIICDIMMPGMDGYEVLRTVRDSLATKLTPFIFLTAKVDRNSQRIGMNTGADDYITKPFEPEDLLNAIKTRLQRHAEVENKFENLRRQIGYMLPHELRTPLMSILGFAEILQAPLNNPDPQYLASIGLQIYQSGKQLERQVENYLLYTELSLHEADETAHDDLLAQNIAALAPMLTYIARERATHHKRKQDLHLLTIEDARLHISESHLHKLLSEVLDNAFKFSLPGTAVNVSTHQLPQGIRLCVSNIARNNFKPEEVVDIGAAYMQFQRKYYEQQGAGLGLAIARKLALLYGGALHIETASEDGEIKVRIEFINNP